tara:strand:- start:19 stop:804 length:786 start_codon:yes stop_codon:yes gene_type:complete
MINFLILCAGQGTRLKPLTNNIPKALINFNSKRLLDFQLENLYKKKRIKKIFIATGYKHKKFKKYKEKKIFIKDFKEKNMLHSLIKSLKVIGNKNDIIISYGDIIYNSQILNKIIKSKNNFSVISDKSYFNLWSERLENPLNDLETFICDKKNFLTEIGKKAENYKTIQGQYIGIFKIKKFFFSKILECYKKKKYFLPKKKFDRLDITTFIQFLIESGYKIKVLNVYSGWLEFDTYRDWKLYKRMIKNKKKIKKLNLHEFV